MIPARIISIDDKVMVEWPPEPDRKTFINETHRLWPDAFADAVFLYKRFKTITEVENAVKYKDKCYLFHYETDGDYKIKILKEILSLNQTVFIEPTETGKCKIIKI